MKTILVGLAALLAAAVITSFSKAAAETPSFYFPIKAPYGGRQEAPHFYYPLPHLPVKPHHPKPFPKFPPKPRKMKGHSTSSR